MSSGVVKRRHPVISKIKKPNHKSSHAIINGNPYFGVMAGMGFARIGKQQSDTTIGIDCYEKYLPSNSYRGTAIYGINGGYEFKLGSSDGLLSFGVGIYQSLGYRSEGQIWCLYDPDGNDHELDYNYRLQSTRFMFETQFGWQFNFKKVKLIPFISLGMGTALNFANNYNETLVSPDYSLVPGFKSKRNTDFAYQLGAGIACPFGNDLNRLFVSYRYVDLGRGVRFSQRSVDYAYQLDTGRIRSNEIYVGYTHLFNF